ncbi:MAG: hypothetical protein OEW85_14985, partial [Acidimicrobiia bacterium]|nr:hypothetical protein [Acidimicrobiia bacterium]
NGDVDESAVNTGLNTGIMAGDDVDLDDSIVGHGNTQLNDSTVGAFSGRGNATNVAGENVNMGSGDLIDVDAGGDAQVANGHGNEFQGDTSVALAGVDGPVNLAFGDGNRQNALEDNSTNIEDSFNTDNSIEDSFNTAVVDSGNFISEDNDTTTTSIEDSGNFISEDNDTYETSVDLSYEDNSSYQDNDTWTTEVDLDLDHVDVWGDDNELDLD